MIAGAVEIRDDQVNARNSELAAVRLRLNKCHLLGHGLRGARGFRISIPEIILMKRDGGAFGIAVGRAEKNDFLDAVNARLLEDVDSHESILMKRRGLIRAACGMMAADPRGEMHDGVRTDFGE